MTISRRNRKQNLDNIRSSIGERNLVSSCSRDGCRVHLDKIAGDWIIVDMDLAFPAHEMEGRRCDFVFYTIASDGDILAIPMELKSGTVDASEVVKQLQGGVDFVKRFTPQAVCHPVLFHGGSMKKLENIELRKKLRIIFNNRHLTVITVRCDRSGNLARCLKRIEG